MFGMGVGELILLGAIAVLLFGSRLPEVARTLGQHYNTFRRGLDDIKREMTSASSTVNSTFREATNQMLTYEDDDYSEPTAPKFDVPKLTPPSPPAMPSSEDSAVDEAAT